MNLPSAYVQIAVYDCEYGREIRNRLIFRHIVIDAKSASHIHEIQLESLFDKILRNYVHLVAEVLEDVELAYLRTYVQVHSFYIDIFEGLYPLRLLQHFLVGNAELGVCLAGVDAMVGFRVYVRVHPEPAVHHLAHCRRNPVYDLQFLERFAVYGKYALLDCITYLLVFLTYSRIHYGLRIEACLYCAPDFVSARAVYAQPVLAYDFEYAGVIVCLDGVVYLEVIF